MTQRIAALFCLTFTFCLFPLVASGQRVAWKTAVDSGLKNFQQEQELVHIEMGREMSMPDNGRSCYFLFDEFPKIKVLFMDCNHCDNMATFLRWSHFPLPVQAIFNGMELDENHEYKNSCLISYYSQGGRFLFQNQETAERFSEPSLFNAYGFAREVPVDTSLDALLATTTNKKTITLKFGKKWLEYNKTVRECLQVYHCLWKDQVKKKKCLKLHKPTALEKKCSKDWRVCIRKMFDKKFAPTCNKCDEAEDSDDVLEEPDTVTQQIGANQLKWCVGHIPDTCVGGHSAPGGCFWRQESRCNAILGSACGRAIKKIADEDHNGDRSKVCVEYKVIEILDGDGKKIPEMKCSGPQTDPKVKKAREEIEKCKKEFWNKVKEKVGDEYKWKTCIQKLYTCWACLGDAESTILKDKIQMETPGLVLIKIE